MPTLPETPLETNTSSGDSTCLHLLALSFCCTPCLIPQAAPAAPPSPGTWQKAFCPWGTGMAHLPSKGALASLHSTAHSRTPWRVWSTARIRDWATKKPYHCSGKRQMWFLRLVSMQARHYGLQEGKICNKHNLSSQPWWSYPAATLTSGCWTADTARSISDSLLLLCQTPPGTEKSLPVRNLQGSRFSLWHLHCMYFSIW